ncbi:hypothetical protein ACG3SL_13430 [Sphingomonas sp. CJ20]
MKRMILTIAGLALVPAVLVPVSAAYAQAGSAMTPAQAIAAAATAGEAGVTGVFEFQVGSAAGAGFNTYLNSEPDYRSPANLSIQLKPAAINGLKTRLGGFPEDVLKGKRVRAKGVARRVEITGRDGTKHYQTRIEIEDASQLEVLG